MITFGRIIIMKLKQIIKILCLAFLIWGVSVVVANAASASISASSRNVTTGTKVTIKEWKLF